MPIKLVIDKVAQELTRREWMTSYDELKIYVSGFRRTEKLLDLDKESV
ncbi:MAG TPA: hypothetical protein VKB86_17985 [Pyrinomonadaceae bacterium]|nr:hypothetical protein [Pyrinomonadaceae bacterium]